MTLQSFRSLRGAFLGAVFLPLLFGQHAYAIVGAGGESQDPIDQKYIDFGAQFGNTVGFLSYNNGTATGTFVPSSEIGKLKFLTAAHNVVKDDGTPFGGLYKIFFGSNTGPNGGTATYRVDGATADIVANPLYGQNDGQATHDMAVITFDVSQVKAVLGGAIPSVTHVTAVNPAGMLGTLVGHGGHGMGQPTFADANPDGVIKAGQNIIDFNGVPAPETAGATVSNTSGQVLLADLDSPAGNTSTFGSPTPVPLEAGTATGDSGGPVLVMVDGQLQVVGVLNGGDNPFGKASEHGDLTQHATTNTPSNQAFLQSQGVFLGSTAAGIRNFTVVDLLAAQSAFVGLSSAITMKGVTQELGTAHVSDVRGHIGSVQRGTSLLDRAGGAEVNSSGRFVEIEAPGTGRYEVWVGGDYQNTDTQGNGGFTAPNGSLGYEIDQYTATTGIDYLLNESLLAGLAYSYLEGDAVLPGTSIDSTGHALSLYLVGKRGALSSSFIYSYSSTSNDMTRVSASGPALANPDSHSHIVDWSAAYTIRQGRVIHGPTAGLQYVNGSVDGYSERSAGGGTRGLLNVNGQDFDHLIMEAGYGVSYHKETDWGTLVPYANTALVHRVGSDERATATLQQAAFFNLVAAGGGVALAPTNNPLGVTGDGLDNTYWRFQLGLEAICNSGWRMNLSGFTNADETGSSHYGGGLQVGRSF